MKEKHKCWPLKKNERPFVSQYRFCCLEQAGKITFVERWHCWGCGKEVRYKIPLGLLERFYFKRTVYWKAQKCHKQN